MLRGLKLKWALGLLAVLCGVDVAVADQWHSVITCKDDGGNAFHVKTTYDRGSLPEINKRYLVRGASAIVTVYSPDAQIPGSVDLDTGLNIELSRTNSFLSFWTEIKSSNGQTIIRRYENDVAELWRYEISGVVPLSTGTGSARVGALPDGKWVKYALKCKP